MKILGILFTVLFSSFAISHGHKNLALRQEAPARATVLCEDGSVQYVANRPNQSKSGSRNDGAFEAAAAHTGPAVIKNIRGQPSYQKSASNLAFGIDAAPSGSQKDAVPVGQNAAPVRLSVSYQKKLGPTISPGPANNFMKNVGSGDYNSGPVNYNTVPSQVSLSHEKNEGFAGYNPEDREIPCWPAPVGTFYSHKKNLDLIQPDASPAYSPASYEKSAGPAPFDAVPSGVYISYKKDVGIVDNNAAPAGPSISFQNTGPAGYIEAPAGPSVSNQNTGSSGYNEAPAGPSVSDQNTGPTGYDTAPSGVYISYGSAPANPSVPYQKHLAPVNYDAVPAASPSYQKDSGSVAYNIAPSGISNKNNAGSISFIATPIAPSVPQQKEGGTISFIATPMAPSVPQQKNTGPVTFNAVPSGVSVSHQQNVGSVGYNVAPDDSSVPYQNTGTTGYNVIPVSRTVYYQNTGSTGYIDAPLSLSVSYQKSPASVNSNTVPSQVSISYEKNEGVIDFNTIGSNAAPTSPIVSYEKNTAPESASYQMSAEPGSYDTVPSSIYISYEKNVEPVSYDGSDMFPTVFYQNNVGSIGNNNPISAPAPKSETTNPVLILTSYNQPAPQQSNLPSLTKLNSAANDYASTDSYAPYQINEGPTVLVATSESLPYYEENRNPAQYDNSDYPSSDDSSNQASYVFISSGPTPTSYEQLTRPDTYNC